MLRSPNARLNFIPNLTLKSDNVPADRKVLEKHGAVILSEVDEQWGHMLVFEDPDGNVLKLMHPKHGH